MWMLRARIGTRCCALKRLSMNRKLRSSPARCRTNRLNHWATERNSPTTVPSGATRCSDVGQVDGSLNTNCGIRRYVDPSARW